MRCLFNKFQLLSKIQTSSHKTFGQTNSNHTSEISMPKNLHAGLSSDFEQFFLVKKKFVYF